MSAYGDNMAQLDAAIDAAKDRGASPWWIVGVLASALASSEAGFFKGGFESAIETLERVS